MFFLEFILEGTFLLQMRKTEIHPCAECVECFSVLLKQVGRKQGRSNDKNMQSLASCSQSKLQRSSLIPEHLLLCTRHWPHSSSAIAHARCVPIYLILLSKMFKYLQFVVIICR
jgi:hypothetical protein